MTERQLQEWYVFDESSPIGSSDRIELMLAQICAILINIGQAIGGKGGHNKPVTLADFLPIWWGQNKKGQASQTTSEMKEVMRAIANGQKKGGGK